MGKRNIVQDTLQIIVSIGAIHSVKKIEYVDASDVYEICCKGHTSYTLEYIERIMDNFINSSLFKKRFEGNGKLKYHLI